MIAQNTLATYRGSISFDETLFIDSTDVGSGVTGSSASVMAVTVPASRFGAALVGFGGLFRVAACFGSRLTDFTKRGCRIFQFPQAAEKVRAKSVPKGGLGATGAEIFRTGSGLTKRQSSILSSVLLPPSPNGDWRFFLKGGSWNQSQRKPNGFMYSLIMRTYGESRGANSFRYRRHSTPGWFNPLNLQNSLSAVGSDHHPSRPFPFSGVARFLNTNPLRPSFSTGIQQTGLQIADALWCTGR